MFLKSINSKLEIFKKFIWLYIDLKYTNYTINEILKCKWNKIFLKNATVGLKVTYEYFCFTSIWLLLIDKIFFINLIEDKNSSFILSQTYKIGSFISYCIYSIFRAIDEILFCEWLLKFTGFFCDDWDLGFLNHSNLILIFALFNWRIYKPNLY